MHIGFCGPATLSLLEDLAHESIDISGYPFPGSSYLIREYLRMGHRVTLFTTSPEIAETREFGSGMLHIVAVPSRSRGPARSFDFFAMERKSLRSAIARVKPDVLHAHWTYQFGLAARQSPMPSVVTVHDWAPAVARSNRHPYWYFRWAMQIMCLSYAGILTAPSEYIAAKVRRWYGKPCLVIPNGVDLDGFDSLKATCDGEVRVGLLNVGFSALKNVTAALRAWPIVKREFPAARLVVAGPGFEIDGLAHSWARENGLDADVDFVGSVDPKDLPHWFATLDIFLHPSLEESFGMVLVEAMASGLPVVAGQASGAVPSITGGKALLVDVTSEVDIAAALVRLMTSKAERLQLSLQGRDWVKRYALQAVATEYESALSNAMNSR